MLLSMQEFAKVPLLILSCMAFLLFNEVAVAIPKNPSNEDHTLFIVNRIYLQGNHVTKDVILYRELLFKEGDTLNSSEYKQQVEQSRKNLLNTSLFNFVTIHEEINGTSIDIRIEVVERWYIWPSPIFELTDRNFNSWWKSQDYSRVNYGFRLKWGNFRGRMENLDIMLRFGKNQNLSLIYSIPYIDKAKKLGTGIELGYLNKREVGFSTESDQLKYLFDDAHLMKQVYAAWLVSYRRNIHVMHNLSLRFQHVSFADTLLNANPDYFYYGNNSADYLSLYYKLKADYRDARYYPLSGWYVDLELLKSGLGLTFEKPVDLFWFKSTSRLFIPVSKRWFYGGSLVGKVSAGKEQPYFLMQGLGYERDYVRGYEYYVVDGAHYLLTRNTIRYAVIPEKEVTIGAIPYPKFGKIHYAAYLTVFGDAGYTWAGTGPENLNKLPETLLLGTGIGLDLVTYYDKVFRFEYSFNKSGENGIFIHFIAGI
jgi:outer membrane protein assembly factor BamA